MAFKSKRAGGDSEDYKPCQHLLDYKSKYGIQAFHVLHKCLKTGPPGRASIRREEKEVPRCATCGKAQGRLYACLVCATIGCWVPPEQLHSRLHAQTKFGHDLAVDVDRAELFCCLCNDQVYDADFDRAVIGAQCLVAVGGMVNVKDGSQNGADGATDGKGVRSSKGGLSLKISEAKGTVGNGNDVSDSNKKDADEGRDRKRRKGTEYKSWVPTPLDILVLRQGSTPLVEDCLPSGLRGLNNLGNTCFMNSVLQALLHTPPLRNYFLSDRHNRSICQRRAAHLCLGCDMDTIFSAAFSGERTPYSPAQFLYSWWRHAANLAGYEQQDAHEFFISTVDGIHANSGTTSPRARNSQSGRGDVDCRCIVHRVFSGLLRSDVTCTVCGFTSTTYDPCVDISLDLEPDIRPDSKIFMDSIIGSFDSGRSSRGSFANGITGNSTLLGCLDRFTRPERLGANEKFYCQRCQTRQESIKQMSVRKLPLVLCFHIKRFEHSPIRNTSRKVDRYMQFPFSLDMAPYISSSIVRSRHGNRLLFLETGEMWASQSPSTEFELFAVVTHSGKLDSGHYVSFIRLAGQWYKCDDAWVTRVSEEVVRASQGYMLYYVLKTLSYKSSDYQDSTAGHDSDANGTHGYTWSSSGVTNGT